MLYHIARTMDKGLLHYHSLLHHHTTDIIKKTNIVPIHDNKVYGGMETKLYRVLILQLDRHEWSVSCPSHTTPQKKEPPCPLKSRLDEFQSQSQHFGEDKNILPPTLIETQFFGHPLHSPLTILSWRPNSLNTKKP